MKSASDLSEEQKQTVLSWAEEGVTLQDVQDRLDEEFGLRFTFMETRFLAGDLNLPIKSEVKEEPEKEDEETEAADEIPDNEATGEVPEDIDPSGSPAPAVTVDQIAIPGTLVSGKVVFSGGNNASWSLDQFGQLSLNPDDPNFRPGEDEVIAFQKELQREARKQGL